MLAFVSTAQLSERQVKSHKRHFEELHLVHKGTALSKQKPTTGTKRVGRILSLTSTTTKAG